MSSTLTGFAERVVQWQRDSGRNNLPWQGTREPYLVWLSEIMLQQTQVVTATVYFERFVRRFPDVQSLALASLDEVLGLWSGLGYYSRARNLHRCAQQVVQQYGGKFPVGALELQGLPGIGRSTAAAIAAFCHGERVAILDGNVKRVLTRVLGFAEDISNAAAERALWEQAQRLLPRRAPQANMPRYTQGLMDLGANLCSRRAPRCTECPVSDLCSANRDGDAEKYPVRTRKLKRSSESMWLLWAEDDEGAVWLHRRPDRGIWAGLHCLPVFDSFEALLASLGSAQRSSGSALAVVPHTLTHKDLFLHPVRFTLPGRSAPAPEGAWFGASQWSVLGLPAPIRTLLGAA